MSDEVTIAIPPENIEVITGTPEVQSEVSEQAGAIQVVTGTTSKAITCQAEGCGQVFTNFEEFSEHLKTHMTLPVGTTGQEIIEKPEETKPQRNEKGQLLKGNTVSVGNTGGNECDFCKKPVEIINKVNLYREWCRGNVDGKQHIPYIQELVSEDYLDITRDQLEDWVKSQKHKEQHAELARTISKLKNRQQLLLLKTTLTDKYRGAIFQLSANHGMIEQSKQYQAGVKDEPQEYNINIVPKSRKQIEQDQDE